MFLLFICNVCKVVLSWTIYLHANRSDFFFLKFFLPLASLQVSYSVLTIKIANLQVSYSALTIKMFGLNNKSMIILQERT